VLPGGCSGFQYGLNIEDEAQDDDDILESNGVRLFVDPFSGQYLDGVEIDYVTTMMGSGFTFKNPNAAAAAAAAARSRPDVRVRRYTVRFGPAGMTCGPGAYPDESREGSR
jgi:iron-sulfur cluster assembly accessory protein